MVPENIKKFNKCAAEIFDYLYPKFPVESDIRVDDFKDYTNEEDIHRRIIFAIEKN